MRKRKSDHELEELSDCEIDKKIPYVIVGGKRIIAAPNVQENFQKACKKVSKKISFYC